jgi:acetyl esterase/lipase
MKSCPTNKTPMLQFLVRSPSTCSWVHALPSYKQHLCPTNTKFIEAYKPDHKSHLFNIYAAPYNFKGLPPTFFQICGMDPLRDEAMLYERLLREEYNTKTSLKLYPGLPHGFWSFVPSLKSSKGFVEDTVEGVSWLLKQK